MNIEEIKNKINRKLGEIMKEIDNLEDIQNFEKKVEKNNG